jgi:TonB family protein
LPVRTAKSRLLRMRQFFLLALLSMGALSTGLFACAQDAFAQSAPNSSTPQIWVALATLSHPVYPPLARQARIMGDVKVKIGIRRNGIVASAEVVSGHPLLRQAALESAKKSLFICQECSEEETPYLLTYTFAFRDGGDDGDCQANRQRSSKCLYMWKCGIWQERPAPPPIVGQSLDRVVIVAPSMCVETIRSTTGQ